MSGRLRRASIQVVSVSTQSAASSLAGQVVQLSSIRQADRVPAVVATGNGAEILPDGEIVTVDGTVGVISLGG
jgi:phosphohistidine swiveling domain-containing protein